MGQQEKPVIGLDFGNYNTYLSYIADREDGNSTGGKAQPLVAGPENSGIPSVYFYSDERGERCGADAVTKAATPLDNRVRYLKLHMGEPLNLGGKEIGYDHAITAVIQNCFRRAVYELEEQTHRKTNRVVVAYPASFTGEQIRHLVELTEQATLEDSTHLKVEGTISEPAAAALDYLNEYAPETKESTVLVYDLGGGTFDLALMAAYPGGKTVGEETHYYKILDHGGSDEVGGRQFDEVLYRLAESRFPTPLTKWMQSVLRDTLKNNKKELDSADETVFELARGEDYEVATVTRGEYESACMPLIQRTVRETGEILRRRQSQQPDFILLTGGASRMPRIREELEKAFPQYRGKIFPHRHSEAVSFGAARFGCIKQAGDTVNVFREKPADSRKPVTPTGPERISGKLSLRMVPMKDRLTAGMTFFRLSDDGRVKCGTNAPSSLLDSIYKELDVGKWRNIVAIDAGPHHTVGLRSDGTVVATGPNLHGECSVSAWKNITAICADSDTFGLHQDGTVVSTGSDWDTSSLRNVTGIACGTNALLGLHADGTLTGIGRKGETPKFFSELQRWRDLVAAATGIGFVVGLHANGTVTAAGDNSKGACNVSSWRQIISVRCGLFHTVGLRSDGTVVATGINSNGQCDVSTWRNIVAIAASDQVTYGLCADGTVVSTKKESPKKPEKTDSTATASQGETVHSHKTATPAGQTQPQAPTALMKAQRTAASWGSRIAVNLYGAAAISRRGRVYTAYTILGSSCMEDVASWDNIVSIKAGLYHFVGLRADGTVVAAGRNKEGQCIVETWRDVIAIAAGGYCTFALCRDGRILSTKPLLVNGKESKTFSARRGAAAIFSNMNGELCCVTSGGRVTVHVTEPRNHTIFSGAEHWQNITSLAMGERHIVGLRSDGTVVATGENNSHQCEVEDWRDIIAVYAESNRTIGLRADGTAVVTSPKQSDCKSYGKWDNLFALAITQPNPSLAYGLTKNGTIVSNVKGADTTTSGWKLFD